MNTMKYKILGIRFPKLLTFICLMILALFYVINAKSLIATAKTTTDNESNKSKSINESTGILHGFYPATTSYTSQIEEYMDALDSISFAWSRIDAKDYQNLNMVKGKKNNYGFYYPKDYKEPITYAKENGKTIQLSIYLDGEDAVKLLPYEDKRTSMIQTIIDTMQTEVTHGFYYDGVVIDFEGLRNTDDKKTTIYHNGETISVYFTQFLEELKDHLESIDKTLLVAVNPLLYYDGYDYPGILNASDNVILMAHDYEPTIKLQKNQVQQYMDYNTLNPIHSLAPINLIRKALNDFANASSDPLELNKVWLQISFDISQWQYNVKNEKSWNTLSQTTLSKNSRVTPLYKSLKDRIQNKDGNGKNITYGYNNELQSPYIHYYNKSDKTMNVIIYEDSNSIKAKIDLAKSYQLGGISLWSLGNVPNYKDSISSKYHLDGWSTIVSSMGSYNVSSEEQIKTVIFTDSGIEKAVRDKIGKPSGNITVYDLEGIYRIKLASGVKKLKDLKMLPNLEYLDASNLGINDISALSSLKKLRVLILNNNQISNINALKKLTKLTYLDLSVNKITSIEALSKLTALETLFLQRNSISGLNDLSSLKKIRVLSLNGNKVTALSPLAKLTTLEKLYLKENAIKSISSLKGLVHLNELYLKGNTITNYDPVKSIVVKNGFISDFSIN